MNKRYQVTKREGIDGPPIPDDEPYLVIRAQDTLADFILGTYIDRYLSVYGEVADPQVIQELKEHRKNLRQWQAVNKTKMADR